MKPGPLEGTTVVVTRAQSQAAGLAEQLEAQGATVVSVATIEISPPVDGGAHLRDALDRRRSFSQVVVSSPNGAQVVVDASGDMDPTTLPPVACVGPSTAAIFDASPWTVNVVPDRAVAEGLLASMSTPAPDQASLLLVQAEVARDVLEIGLRELGFDVERVVGYRTIDAQVSEADREAAKSADIVTFTSSSTVERFLRLVGREALPLAIASIGPITSQTARDLGVGVDIEADPHTINGLVEAVVAWATS